MTKWQFKACDSLAPEYPAQGWRLYCGDEPTQIYAISLEAGEMMAALLSYGSATRYECKAEPLPLVPTAAVLIQFRRHYAAHAVELAATTAMAFPPATMLQQAMPFHMMQLAETTCKRLNHADDEVDSVNANAGNAEAIGERDALLKFKLYVHKRLDDAGVPADPMPDLNKQTGCRIGCRLDWLLERLSPAMARADDSLQNTQALKAVAFLTKCKQAGAWLAAFFRIVDGPGDTKKIVPDYVTCRFPEGDFPKVGDMLAGMVAPLAGPLPPADLPEATPAARPTLGNMLAEQAEPGNGLGEKIDEALRVPVAD